MRELRFETTVALPIEQVWALFQDVEQLLPRMTPPGQGLVIEKVEPKPPGVGTQVHLRVKSPMGRIGWVARYVEFVPPHATITGVEARFVDEQVTGPFKYWRHAHEFEAIDDRTTRCIDAITFAAPYGPLGWVADYVIVGPSLVKLFKHRATVLKQIAGG